MDTSWLTLTSNTENKENATTTTTISCGSAKMISSSSGRRDSLNNLSLNSYGILATLNGNNAANVTSTSLNMNDSFDQDKLKFDVYEKQIQKLAYENQQLRKRVKNLKELARSKEEQLIENFQTACEDKVKNEEKNQIEYK
jgi:hypothetical protein